MGNYDLRLSIHGIEGYVSVINSFFRVNLSVYDPKHDIEKMSVDL
jgi:hypothetical protein